MIHELTLKESFCDAIYDGNKTFEIRENDRGFQTGDKVKFIPRALSGVPMYHKIENKLYEITYVLSGWGIKEGYIVFGIKEINEDES